MKIKQLLRPSYGWYKSTSQKDKWFLDDVQIPMYVARKLIRKAGINYYTLKGRLTHYGWTVERAISEPSFKGKNQTYKGAVEC